MMKFAMLDFMLLWSIFGFATAVTLPSTWAEASSLDVHAEIDDGQLDCASSVDDRNSFFDCFDNCLNHPYDSDMVHCSTTNECVWECRDVFCRGGIPSGIRRLLDPGSDNSDPVTLCTASRHQNRHRNLEKDSTISPATITSRKGSPLSTITAAPNPSTKNDGGLPLSAAGSAVNVTGYDGGPPIGSDRHHSHHNDKGGIAGQYDDNGSHPN